MKGWVGDIEAETLRNANFRTTLFTGQQLQLTVMTLGPGEEIGRETHQDTDQFIRVEEGRATVEIDGETHQVEADWAVIIPAGAAHNVVNAGDGPLKLYSLYAPPEHPPNTVHETKAEADAAEAAHHSG